MGQMRGVILSGGKGSRLRPLTYTGAKQLVPIANKPILFYGIEQLVEAGVEEIAIVVSPETGDQVRAATGDGGRFGARIRYVTQPEPRGIAHAIRLCREMTGDAPFVTFLGDNFLTHGIVPYAQAFLGSGADAGVLLKQVPDPREFGVARFEGERLVQVVEKPKDPPSDLAVIGIYFFTPCVYEAIDALQPSARGEYEVTDTIQWLIDSGRNVRADVVKGDWIDTGKREDLLTANRLILETLERDTSRGRIDDRSKVEGRVVLQEDCQIINSVIAGPAIIGERARIEDAYVGPFTSIGPECVVSQSEIAGSVVMEGTRIERLGERVEQSLIGRHVEVMAIDSKPHGYQLVLGDYSRLRLP